MSSTTTATASYNGVQVVTLWNRYASNCKANWARAQLTTAAVNAGYRMRFDVSTYDSHNPQNFEFMCYPGPDPDNIGAITENCTGLYGGSVAAFTDMMDGTNAALAEVYVYNSSGVFIAYAATSRS